MIEFIEGRLIELTPTYAVVNVTGIGYLVHISLNTYTGLKGCDEQIRLLCHQVIREDAHLLFGFMDEKERKLFRLLISVSGVGASTAQVFLSSMSPDEVIQAILSENTGALQSVKGIGGKTAQRVIVDLKDKLKKGDFASDISAPLYNTFSEEALSGLIMLGFSRQVAQKAIDKVIGQGGGDKLTVESLIKQALQIL